MVDIVAPITAGPAPWWVGALFGGMLTLVGTLGGASIGFLSTKASDKRRAAEEARKLDRADRKEAQRLLRLAAARFLVEARQFVRDYRNNFHAITSAAGQTIYVCVEDPKPLDSRKTYDTYWQVVLLGNDAVSAAARALLNATRPFDFAHLRAREVAPMTPEDFAQRYSEHIKARKVFVRCVLRALSNVPAEPKS